MFPIPSGSWLSNKMIRSRRKPCVYPRTRYMRLAPEKPGLQLTSCHPHFRLNYLGCPAQDCVSGTESVLWVRLRAEFSVRIGPVEQCLSHDTYSFGDHPRSAGLTYMTDGSYLSAFTLTSVNRFSNPVLPPFFLARLTVRDVSETRAISCSLAWLASPNETRTILHCKLNRWQNETCTRAIAKDPL